MAETTLQIEESKGEMYSLIREQTQRLGEQRRNHIMESEAFSIERLEHAGVLADPNAEQSEQIKKLNAYRSKRLKYEKELRELEGQRDTPDGKIAFNCKRIEAEQNDMELRLMQASVLGMGTVVKRIRTESLEKIISYRKEILDSYDSQPELSRLQRKRRDGQQEEIDKEQAAYEEAESAFHLRVLTTAALAEIEEGRDNAEQARAAADAAGTMREFLDADFSEQALEAGYVIENLSVCLRNVELIRRVKNLESEMGEEAYAPVKLKLAAVEEYANVVESVLWEYGLTIDFDTLRIKEIREDEEAFVKRRRAYLANGALRFRLGVKRYSEIEEDTELFPDAQQQDSVKTRVEEKLSALETELAISDFRSEEMRITRSFTRDVGKSSTARPGDVIRADAEDHQGKTEHLQMKMRLLKIFHKYKERLGDGGEAFRSLEPFIEDYAVSNREIYGNRREAEEKEAKALAVLKNALARVHRFAKDVSGRYAAILYGVLTEESSGYLETQPDGIHIRVADKNIGLGQKEHSIIARTREFRDCRDMPLFSHRPNIKDVEQGGLGDCYLLAGLLSLVDQNAEEVMNLMKDNGDGTVTVCFKREETENTGSGVRKVYKPHYVTVEKTVPVIKVFGWDAFSKGALWVKMIEKAYVASGLHIDLDEVNKKRQEEGQPNLAYEDVRRSIQTGAWKVDYDDIVGGWTGRFMGLLLGKESKEHLSDAYWADHVADKIGRLLPPESEPTWDQDPAREFGNESVDSFVYELIKSDEGLKAQFLHLKKPAQSDPDYETHMERYNVFKDLLWNFRRSCVICLDIMHTIAAQSKTDILRLDNEEKATKWYEKLKTMFAHFKDTQSENWGKEDKIIGEVQKNYSKSQFFSDFSTITKEEFNGMMDILKQRHKKMLADKNKPETADGAAAPVEDRYYTTRDYKLYDKISEALRTGAYVAFGTRKLSDKKTGLNGESELGGLVGTHAYSIINTRKKRIGGVERLFFVVMNPWAEKGVVYDVGAGDIKERAVRGRQDGEKEEGVFLLDLRKFAEIVTRWDAVPA